jgi:hypothetical protein
VWYFLAFSPFRLIAFSLKQSLQHTSEGQFFGYGRQ